MSTDDGLREAVEALAVEWWGRATEATRAPSWRKVVQDLRAALAEHPATPAEPDGFYVKPSGTTNEPVVRDTP